MSVAAFDARDTCGGILAKRCNRCGYPCAPAATAHVSSHLTPTNSANAWCLLGMSNKPSSSNAGTSTINCVAATFKLRLSSAVVKTCKLMAGLQGHYVQVFVIFLCLLAAFSESTTQFGVYLPCVDASSVRKKYKTRNKLNRNSAYPFLEMSVRDAGPHKFK